MECQVCGFKVTGGNLIPHIESDHSDLGLKGYMQAYGGLDSVVLPEFQGTKPKSKKKSKPEPKTPEFKENPMPIDPSLAHAVPAIDQSYHLPPIAEEIAHDCKHGRPTMLIGHTGTGKTSLVEQLAAKIGQPTVRANMNGQTSVSDFVGFHGAKAGETVWIDGVLPYAMRNGLWLIVDEIDYAEAEILSVLNAVLEPKCSLVLKENGHEVIQPHPNFRLFATANTAGAMSEFRGLYQGTKIMNEAFLDRWSIHIVDYLPEKTEAKVVADKVGIDFEIARALVQVANLARTSFQNEELQATFSTRRLINWAEKCVYYKSLKDKAAFKAAESTIFSKVSREDKVVLNGLMERVLLGKNR